MQALTTLNLEYNQIGAQGAQHLVKLKKTNRTLRLEVDDEVSRAMDRCVIS